MENTWLCVTVKATAHTALAAPDIFYFGNLVGDTGNDRGTPTVNATDLARTRRNVGKTTAAALATYDFNRDGVINAVDVGIVRANQRRSLPLFTAPANAPAAAAFSDVAVAIAAPARAAARPPRRGLLDGDPAGLLASAPADDAFRRNDIS